MGSGNSLGGVTAVGNKSFPRRRTRDPAVSHSNFLGENMTFAFVSDILRRTGCLAFGMAAVFFAVPAGVLAADVKILAPGAITYKADANIQGVAVALIDGNPREGAYTVRAKFDRNVRIPAHSHPDTRVVTVISGTYYFGQGDKYDETAIQGHGPGTVIVVPANTPHFAGSAEDGAIVQESGVGPTGITLTGK